MEQNTQLMTVQDMKAVAADIAKSKLFAMEQPEQIFALMMVCQSEGLHPIQALKRYHIIEGRPSMRADAMQAEFQRQGGTLEWVESSNEACEAIFSHPCMPTPFRLRVTLKDYIDSGVAMGYDRQAGKPVVKKNWKQFPGAMLRARVISSGVRAVLPGVVAGIYTPEEVQDFEKPGATAPVAPAAVPPKAPAATKPAPVQATQKATTKPAATVVEAEFTPVEETAPTAGELAEREQGGGDTYSDQEGANVPDSGQSAPIDPARAAAIEALPAETPKDFAGQSTLVKAIKKLLPTDEADALSADCKAATSDSVRQTVIQRVLDGLRAEVGAF